jgi:hypothetical protein
MPRISLEVLRGGEETDGFIENCECGLEVVEFGRRRGGGGRRGHEVVLSGRLLAAEAKRGGEAHTLRITVNCVGVVSKASSKA